MSENSTSVAIPEVSEGFRFDYMDNLRAFAMVLGLFYHAALAYSPFMDNFWLSASVDNSVPLDFVAWFSHTFRMPLFFVVAGFFALMMLDKRGIKGFVANRSKRILAPLLVFLPFITVGVVGGLMWAQSSIDNLSPMLKFVQAQANNPDAKPPEITTIHLWFLYNLFLFCLGAAVLHKIGLFRQQVLQKLANPVVILLLLPLLSFAGLYTVSFPHPPPDKFMPAPWAFAYFGSFFLLGLILYRVQGVLDSLKKFILPMLVVSLAAFVYVYSQIPTSVDMDFVVSGNIDSFRGDNHLWVTLAEAYIGVYMSIVSILVARSWFDYSSTLMRYIADSSYWVYILHLPVLFFVQYLLLDVEWNMWLEFAISSFGTWGICLITYALLVRSTPIGTLLNGRKYPWFSISSNRTKEGVA